MVQNQAQGVQAMSSGLENTQYKTGYPNPGYVAAIEGRYFYGWVNALTGIATETILTSSGFMGIIEPRKRYIIPLLYLNLATTSDWVTVEWGVTVSQDGGGTFTPRTPIFRIDTGNVQSGTAPSFINLGDLPIALTSAHGGAWTARVQGNDADASLTLGFHGYYEVIEV